MFFLQLYQLDGQWKANKINQKMANWLISNKQDNGIIFFIPKQMDEKLIFHYPPDRHYRKYIINIYRDDKIEEEADTYMYVSINENQIETFYDY